MVKKRRRRKRKNPVLMIVLLLFLVLIVGAGIFAGSILNVSGSISANTGVAPTIPIASVVATNVNAVVRRRQRSNI